MFKGLFVEFCLRVVGRVQLLWLDWVEMSGVDPGDPVGRARFSRG